MKVLYTVAVICVIGLLAIGAWYPVLVGSSVAALHYGVWRLVHKSK